MTLRYVEDYLEFLYGTMDKEGSSTSVFNYSVSTNNKIKLATYDKSPVSSMGAFCAKARSESYESCLTDKQVDLARKIITKYRRQFLSHGIVLPENENDIELRHPVRSIDRSKYLKHDVENKQLHLKFPYDPKKISTLHDYVGSSAGKAEWSNSDRKWTFDLTEGNLAKVLELFQQEDLKIDETLTEIVTDMLSASQKDLPRIAVRDNKLALVNCNPRVNEYLDSKNWDPNDLDKVASWTSRAIALGLEADESILDLLMEKYDNDVLNIIINRKVTLPSNNQPDGPWYNALLKANEALDNHPWVLHLNWWTNKTNWAPFKNMVEYREKDKNSFRVQKQFVELLHGLDDPIVIVDSVIGRDSIRNFIEDNSVKVIYISDIGN
jgi:hypothetical protein